MHEGPSPALFFDTINAFQKSAALKAAIDLGVFTAIGSAPATAAEIAGRCVVSPRGARILCDYLAILGFLTKSEAAYALTPDSAFFLDRKSPAYAGDAADFFVQPAIRGGFDCLTDAVRKGGSAHSEQGTISPEHSVWISFAQCMGPLMTPGAHALAAVAPLDASRPAKVLDISASHGAWGLAFARQFPLAHLVALDWAPVLEVTKANAAAAGVSERFSTIAGDAFESDLGKDYDLVLVPNFLHHFSPADCIRFLKKVRAALREGGKVAIVEFVPNPDRVSPPPSAGFSLVMLATTPEGDAYTFAELAEMLTAAGFHSPEQHALAPTVATAVIGAV